MYILERDVEDPLDCSTSLSNRKERSPIVKFLLTVLTHAIQKLALGVLRALPPDNIGHALGAMRSIGLFRFNATLNP